MLAEMMEGVAHLAVKTVKVSPDFYTDVKGFLVVVRENHRKVIRLVQCLVHPVG